MPKPLERVAPDDAFVPFVLPPSANAASKAAPDAGTVMPGSKEKDAAGFEPFQSPGSAHTHSQAAGKPVVTLQREGDRVTGIRVECQCGQVIELGCSY